MKEVERAFKIAFVGTSCVGKTTIFNELRDRAREDPSIVFVEEAARYFFEHNIVENRFSAETQGRIQDLIIERERAAHAAGARIIICDTSVFNAAAYTFVSDKNGGLELYKRAEFWLPSYSGLLLLVPDDVPYRQDAVRQESEEERESFHRGFVELFELTGTPYTIIDGTLEERLAKVEQILKT